MVLTSITTAFFSLLVKHRTFVDKWYLVPSLTIHQKAAYLQYDGDKKLVELSKSISKNKRSLITRLWGKYTGMTRTRLSSTHFHGIFTKNKKYCIGIWYLVTPFFLMQ